MPFFCKVTGISNLVTEDNLRELFQCCGDLLQLKCVNKDGNVVCIIEFPSEAHLETAVIISGTELGDSKLNVFIIDEFEAKNFLKKTVSIPDKPLSEYEEAVAKMQEMMKGPQNQNALPDEVKRTIYVGNLARAVTNRQIRELFETVGQVLFVKFSGSAQFRYAFVEFRTEESAKASFVLHGTDLGGQSIKIGQAHNPIFKDDIMIGNDVVRGAGRMVEDLNKRYANHDNRESYSRDNDRKQRKRRRRRRRSPSESSLEENEEPEMFWDGFQWHTNKDKSYDIENHVTSIIQDRTEDDQDPTEMVLEPAKQMEDEAQKALAMLKITRQF